MNTHADKSQENKTHSVTNRTSQKQRGGESTFQFVDNRPEPFVQRKLQEMANSSPRVGHLKAFQEMANKKHQSNSTSTTQRQPVFSLKKNPGKSVIQRVKNIKPGEAVTVSDKDGAWYGTVKSDEGEFYMITPDGSTEARNVAQINVTRKTAEATSGTEKVERNTISAEESRRKRAMMQSRRQRGQKTVLHGGISSKKDLDDALIAAGNEEMAQAAKHKQDMAIFKDVLEEPWAQKKLKELQAGHDGFEIKYSTLAGRGETDPGEIRFGPEALQSEDMFRICLRHEFDHAQLFFKALPVGDFIAEYVPKKGGVKKGTFVYQLEEVIVRIRDYEHQKDRSDERFVPQKEAIPRIVSAYNELLKSNREGLPKGYAEDILYKLQQIAHKLEIDLTK